MLPTQKLTGVVELSTKTRRMLVERLKKGAALNDWDKNTFYGGGAKGYTDYPTLAAEPAE